jgi:hypothetical protein
MMRLFFKKLLVANYCTAKWLVNKKMPERVIPGTLLIFLIPLAFFSCGLYAFIIGSIDFKFDSFFTSFIGDLLIIFIIYFFLYEKVKKLIYKWSIEKEYKTLTKSERVNKYILAFIFFWGSFALFFYLSVKFTEGYLVN